MTYKSSYYIFLNVFGVVHIIGKPQIDLNMKSHDNIRKNGLQNIAVNQINKIINIKYKVGKHNNHQSSK